LVVVLAATGFKTRKPEQGSSMMVNTSGKGDSIGDAPIRVLVIGQTGQLAKAIDLVRSESMNISFVGRERLDLTRLAAISSTIRAARPDVVINAAAFTDIDAAEADQATAMAINSRAPGAIAAAAERAGAAMIQLSTSHVFDGDLDRPYREDDHPAPLNIYGATKLLGEEMALTANRRTLVLRSNSLFAPWGDNIFNKIASAEGPVAVSSDIRSNPTSALDLARACLSLAPVLTNASVDAKCWGVYHLAAKGTCTQAEFAAEAMGLMGSSSADTSIRMRASRTADWPNKAPRPRAAALDCQRFEAVFGFGLRAWQEGLAEVVAMSVSERVDAPEPA
jgi:dTDP-4-dehydrorhamnose reductase